MAVKQHDEVQAQLPVVNHKSWRDVLVVNFMAQMTLPSRLRSANFGVLTEGSTGIGKTETIHKMAKAYDAELVTLVTSSLNPTMLYGYAVVRDGDVEIQVPKQLRVLTDNTRRSILFLDEINSGSPTQIAAAQYPSFDRKLGLDDVADTCFVTAAYNPSKIATVGTNLPLPLRNRFTNVLLRPSVDDFVNYHPAVNPFKPLSELMAALGNDETLESAVEDGLSLVRAWQRANPSLIVDTDRLVESGEIVVPTPRSVYRVGVLMAYHRLLEPLLEEPETSLNAIITGNIGASAGVQFLRFLVKTKEVPMPSDVIAGNAKLPTDIEVLYTFMERVVTLTERKELVKSKSAKQSEQDNWEHFWRCMAALYRADVAITAIAISMGVARITKAWGKILPIPTWVMDKDCPLMPHASKVMASISL